MKKIGDKRRKRLEEDGKRLASNSTLCSGTGPARSGKIKPKPRKPSETLRIYGTPARRKWIKSLPCHVADCVKSCGPCEGEIVNAHAVSGGKSRKADANTIVPLCHRHHVMYDRYVAPFDDKAVRASIIGAAAGYDLAFSTRTT